MKKVIVNVLVIVAIIFVVGVLTFFVFKGVSKFLNDDSNEEAEGESEKYLTLQELDIVSRHNEYVIHRHKLREEAELYIYKNVKYNEYERVCYLGSSSEGYTTILWTDDSVYIKENAYVAKCSIETGHKIEISDGDLISKVEFKEPTAYVPIDLLGISDGYLYYKIERKNEFDSYGKIDLDLKEPIIIEESAVPQDLINKEYVK